MTVRLMSDRELRRLEVLQDLDRRRLTPGAAEQLLGHSVSYYLVPSLLWTAVLVLVFAPLAVWKLKTT